MLNQNSLGAWHRGYSALHRWVDFSIVRMRDREIQPLSPSFGPSGEAASWTVSISSNVVLVQAKTVSLDFSQLIRIPLFLQRNADLGECHDLGEEALPRSGCTFFALFPEALGVSGGLGAALEGLCGGALVA